MNRPAPARPPETQPERTALAWTRTSLAVLANGVLLVLGHPGDHPGPIRLTAAGVAAALAVFAFVVGRRRQRILGRRPLPPITTARSEIYALSVSVVALIVVSALAVVI